MAEVYGVFEGGGVRGTALVGAVAAAEEMGITFRAVAGTSAGAIVASYIAAGYNASEMRMLLTDTDFKQFMDPFSRIPFLQQFRAKQALGLYRGDFFHNWIREKLAIKILGDRNGTPTFAQLSRPLTVVATDVIGQQFKIYSNRESLGMSVADAVRRSMSIPFFFQPVRTPGELIVDGGVASNFPAWAFDQEQETHPLPILGLRLQPDKASPKPVNGLVGFSKAVIFTMMKADLPLQIKHVRGLYSISLPTLGIQTTDFDISEQHKDDLYEAGYNAAKAYLATTPLTPPSLGKPGYPRRPR